jgi:hypothetical protein
MFDSAFLDDPVDDGVTLRWSLFCRVVACRGVSFEPNDAEVGDDDDDDDGDDEVLALVLILRSELILLFGFFEGRNWPVINLSAAISTFQPDCDRHLARSDSTTGTPNERKISSFSTMLLSSVQSPPPAARFLLLAMVYDHVC